MLKLAFMMIDGQANFPGGFGDVDNDGDASADMTT